MASDPQGQLVSRDLPSIRWLGRGLSGYIHETTWLGNRYTRKDFPLGSVKRNYVFENEAKSLVGLDHPNIVKYFGYTVGKSSCSLLQEYVDENLQSALEMRIDAQRTMKPSSSVSIASESTILDVNQIKRSVSNDVVKTFHRVIPFQLPEAVAIMLQIAEGVKYLHDNEIPHGDLKPNNVQLQYLKRGQMTVKVADYGLAETKKLIKLVPKRTRHFEVLMWKAPERLDELLGPLTKNSDDPFTESDTDSDVEMESYEIFSKTRLAMADVYSFGLISLHLLGGEPIYPNWSLTQIREERMEYERLQAPPAIPNDLKHLIDSCLEPQPSRRITFIGIHSMLKDFHSQQLPLRSMSEDTASRYASKSASGSESAVNRNPPLTSGIHALPDEHLHLILSKLPLFHFLRARAVCKRWNQIVTETSPKVEDATARSFCPLVFKRNSLCHLWCGYDTATKLWEPLPPLTDLPQVDIRPLAGNGKSLMGFKITSVPSQVVVGNPFTSEWQTLPKSTETWGEAGNILVVDRDVESSEFRIIAIREDCTEIYRSKEEAWTKLLQGPPLGVQEITVLAIRDKLICPTLHKGILFCYAGDRLFCFDVAGEKWTDDVVRLPPHASHKCFQLLECVGNLFAAVEDVAKGTIVIWGLGLRSREFSPMVEMPQELHSGLCRKRRAGKQSLVQLKAVGHNHRMYFWRNFTTNIVEFDFLRRTWAELPQFNECFHYVTDDQSEMDSEVQTYVDASSFEPDRRKLKFRALVL